MKVPFFLLLSIAFVDACLPVAAQGQADPYKNVYSESAWKERDSWQKPNEIIKKMNIDKNSVVADIGCHEGYMTFKLADVAKTVYGVDVEQLKLDKLGKHKPSNVKTIKGDYDDPNLPGKVDAVLILDTYHEMKDHNEILRNIFAALKERGRLVICEPIAEKRRDLTRLEQESKHEIAMKYVVEDLLRAGFKIIEKTDPFVDREKIKGDKMWIIVSTK